MIHVARGHGDPLFPDDPDAQGSAGALRGDAHREFRRLVSLSSAGVNREGQPLNVKFLLSEISVGPPPVVSSQNVKSSAPVVDYQNARK